MAGVRFIFRRTIKDPNFGVIMAKFHANGIERNWSTGFKIHKDFWDFKKYRVKKNQSKPDKDFTFFNVTLTEISDEFVKLYTLEKFSGFRPDMDRIKRMVMQKFDERQPGFKNRNVNDFIYAKISVKDLKNPYMRRLLKKTGYPDQAIEDHKELFQIKRLQVKTHRALKNKTHDNQS